MLKTALATLMAFALSACAVQLSEERTTASGKVLRVGYDEGGQIGNRMLRIADLDRRGVQVQIVGHCVSACTMYLGAQDACVYPEARLSFHGTIPLDGRPKSYWDAQMAAYYPPQVRSWFYLNAAHLQVVYRSLSGAEAIHMGVSRCPEV